MLLFSQFEHSHFGFTSIKQFCKRCLSYNINRVFLKLCRCFCQGRKMCMTFACNSQINFVAFLLLDLVIFWVVFYQVIYKLGILQFYFSRIFFFFFFWQLKGVFVKVWRLIWVQTVWHSGGISERIFWKSSFWNKNKLTTKAYKIPSRHKWAVTWDFQQYCILWLFAYCKGGASWMRN